MTYKVAYGTDTESLEDPYQLVLLYLPDEAEELDSDELTSYINERGINEDGAGTGLIPATALIPFRDTVESLTLAMAGEEIPTATIDRIIGTLTDALVNQHFG